MKREIYRFTLLAIAQLSIIVAPAAGQVMVTAQGVLFNSDIIALIQQSKTKRSTASLRAIEEKIDSLPNDFDTTPRGIQRLKAARVPQRIIDRMKRRTPPNPAGYKEPDKIRIGVVTGTSLAPVEHNQTMLAQIYQQWYGNRPTSSTEVILLKESIDLNIFTEADRTKCDYVLIVGLEGEFKSPEEKQRSRFRQLLAAAMGGLDVVKEGLDPESKAYAWVERSYKMADTASTSEPLLELLASVTKKGDKMALRYRYADVRTRQFIVPDTVLEAKAKNNKEPLLRNLLVNLGNKLNPVIAKKL